MLGPCPTCGSLAFAAVLLGCSPVAHVALQTRDPAEGWITEGVDLDLVRSSVTSKGYCPAPLAYIPGSEVCSLYSP